MADVDHEPASFHDHTEAGTAAADIFKGQKERRRSSDAKQFLGDHVQAGGLPAIAKALAKNGDKKIVFADIVLKINKRNKMQQRLLLITDAAIYNIEPNSYKVKRRITFDQLGSISLSKLPDNFFIFHVPSEYDYLMVSGKKVEIVTRIAESYEESVKKPLNINFGDSFEYRIDSETTREIQFTRVEGGVSTQIYTNKKKGKK
eukprot:comp11764_c0_seq1/m.6359 comp11764_c0_seq1/g.6359  ORF comp11764_c0_seq1/g.6359 comp11764_c0_seq1/m.6359 type:complete len:203 (-) comp11764_c0_seq1:545-1153(-)